MNERGDLAPVFNAKMYVLPGIQWSIMAAPIRVLYVDDEPDLLEIGKLFLERGGVFAVDTLSSVRMALELLNTEWYDAIISDYQMPEMDGIQFLVEVRSRFGQIPFILFTGKGREEVVIQAINSGADFYIQKGGEPRAQFAELAHKIKQATSRKKAEDSLRRSEDEYRYLIEHSDESIVVIQDEMLRLINQRTVRRTGYSKEELLSMPFSALVHPDDRAMTVERHQRRMQGEVLPSWYTLRLMGKDGDIIWVEVSAVIIDWEGRPATITFLNDITERKRALAALKESEEKYRVIFNNEVYAISLCDHDSLQLLDVNDAFIRMYGYCREELLSGMTIRDIIADKNASFSATEKATDRGTSFIPLRYHRKKDGTIFPVEIVGGSHLWNGKEVIFSLIHDITDRKRAEEGLQLTQSRLDSAMEVGRIAWWEMDCKTGDVIFNERKAHLLGYPAEQFSHFSDFTRLVHPDDFEQMMQAMRDHLTGIEKQYDVDYRIGTRDGKDLWFHDIGGVSEYAPDGKPLKVTGLVIDITERKQAEEALIRAKNNLDLILNSIADPVFVKDEMHRRVLGNDAYCRFIGFTRDEMIGKSDHELFPRDQADNLTREDDLVFASGTERVTEEEVVDSQGQDHTIVTKKTLFVDGQGHRFIVGIARDITERKRAEILLNENYRVMQTLIQTIPNPVFFKNCDGVYDGCNRAFETYFGRTSDEIIGKRVFDVAPWEVAEDYFRTDEELFRCPGTKHYESRVISKDGRTRDVVIDKASIVNFDGEVTGIVGVISDITDRKRSEEVLRTNDALLHTLVRIIPDLIWLKDSDGVYLSCNPMFGRFFGSGEDEIVGKTDYDYVDRELADSFREQDQEAMVAGRSVRNEAWITFADNGHRALMEIVRTPIYNDKGKFIGVLGIGRDISERKCTEDAVELVENT
jgi:PAS domain S-box-containing protein